MPPPTRQLFQFFNSNSPHPKLLVFFSTSTRLKSVELIKLYYFLKEVVRLVSAAQNGGGVYIMYDFIDTFDDTGSKQCICK